MAHPLYQQCLRCVNQPVTVYLRSGQTHYGVIQSVSTEGIHLMPLQMEQVASRPSNQVKLQRADNPTPQSSDVRHVFFAPLFLPFAALAGLTLGYAAGSAFPRPYPYGYGYGAPGYGYGYGYSPYYW